MKSEELQAIKERADKATGTQWKVGMASPNGVQNVGTVQGLMTAQVLKINDAEFIAHAREDVPALIAEIERLNEVIEVLLPMPNPDQNHEEHYKRLCMHPTGGECDE